MTSMVSKSTNSCQMSPLASVQEKVSRNKRKFRADPPLGDPTEIFASSQNKCPGYEFSAEKFEPAIGHAQIIACDICSVNQNQSDGLKLDLGLSSPVASSVAGPSRHAEELETEGFEDADWSDLTEAQLEELVLSNLDANFRSAIKKIVSWGYTEEVATRAVLRSGLCYGCKDTVSNIVDNSLMFLRNGQEIDPSKENCFEDLQQLEKYILAELVCVLQEVRPFFSIGDAMWCLLICDMNVSHACAMDSNPLGGLIGDGAPNGSSVSMQSQWKAEAKNSTINLPNPGKPVSSIDYSQGSVSEAPNSAGVRITTKSTSSGVLGGIVSEKEGMSSTFDPLEKTFGGLTTSQSHVSDEKFVCSRKFYSGSSKKDYIARHKSIHLEKNYRTYGCKGSSRAGKPTGLGGLVSDKKLKSVTDSALSIKNTSVESAANCQQVSKREKSTLMKFQSWEKQKSMLQEELMTERRKAAQLLQELEQAKVLKEQFEARWQREEKTNEELLTEASAIRKEREQIEAKAKLNEEMIKSKAENNLQKYKDNIQKLEKEISQLRMKTDFSKIAALRRGIDGSYASRLADTKNEPSHKESSRLPHTSGMESSFHDHPEMCSVKRERECVMCLSEEMSVVFLPCAHQVVCAACNELQEKQGMKDCPSCRTPIERRIQVSYRSSII